MRKALVGVVVVGIVGCAGAAGGAERARPETISGVLAERAKPPVLDLAARSEPSMTGEAAQEAFWDLLKLREVGDALYVPELIKVLEVNAESNRIHRFAAAQALFCIGTEEAHAALKKHLLRADFPVGLSVMYIRGWEMEGKKASEFLDRYHLVEVGKELAVKVDAKVEGEREKRVVRVGVTATNVSGKVLAVDERTLWAGEHVYWRGADGKWVLPRKRGIHDHMQTKWVELKPGESKRAEAAMGVKEEGNGLVIDGDAVEVRLAGAAKYTLRAMVHAQPLHPEVRARVEMINVWAGRAVSGDVEIDVAVR